MYPQKRAKEGILMNVNRISGVSGVAGRTAARRQTKTKAQTQTAARRDRFEVTYQDVVNAEKHGFIEVNGMRYTVSGDMAAQMRSAYDQIKSRNEGILARQTAEANARAAKQQTEAAKREGETMGKAMEIARRISKGGHVPAQDEKFLMQFSQEMYMAAKLMAAMAEEHKEEDSVLEDEEVVSEEAFEPIGEGTEHLEASASDGAVDSVSAAANEASAGPA